MTVIDYLYRDLDQTERERRIAVLRSLVDGHDHLHEILAAWAPCPDMQACIPIDLVKRALVTDAATVVPS